MQTVLVAVGSTRQPKLNAVSEALEEFGAFLDPDARFSVVGIDVPSGVGHTPLSRGELMAGARGRCEALCVWLASAARLGDILWAWRAGLTWCGKTDGG